MSDGVENDYASSEMKGMMFLSSSQTRASPRLCLGVAFSMMSLMIDYIMQCALIDDTCPESTFIRWIPILRFFSPKPVLLMIMDLVARSSRTPPIWLYLNKKCTDASSGSMLTEES